MSIQDAAFMKGTEILNVFYNLIIANKFYRC
jgi:hypothetical protein